MVTIAIDYPEESSRKCKYPNSSCQNPIQFDDKEIFYCDNVELKNHGEYIQCVITSTISDTTIMEISVASLLHNPPAIATYSTKLHNIYNCIL